MTDPIGSTVLVFQEPPAPPAAPVDEDDYLPDDEPVREPVRRSSRPASGAGGPGGRAATGHVPGAPLRMLKGARQAAAGMKISDDAIREVLEDPHDAQPDPTHPERTRLKRGPLTVTTGQDGMILRVTRKK